MVHRGQCDTWLGAQAIRGKIMMWEYKEAGRLLTYQSVGTTVCIYC
jgi:hypothetical protein